MNIIFVGALNIIYIDMINQIDMIISDRQQREVKQDLDEFDDSLSIG